MYLLSPGENSLGINSKINGFTCFQAGHCYQLDPVSMQHTFLLWPKVIRHTWLHHLLSFIILYQPLYSLYMVPGTHPAIIIANIRRRQFLKDPIISTISREPFWYPTHRKLLPHNLHHLNNSRPRHRPKRHIQLTISLEKRLFFQIFFLLIVWSRVLYGVGYVCRLIPQLLSRSIAISNVAHLL